MKLINLIAIAATVGFALASPAAAAVVASIEIDYAPYSTFDDLYIGIGKLSPGTYLLTLKSAIPAVIYDAGYNLYFQYEDYQLSPDGSFYMDVAGDEYRSPVSTEFTGGTPGHETSSPGHETAEALFVVLPDFEGDRYINYFPGSTIPYSYEYARFTDEGEYVSVLPSENTGYGILTISTVPEPATWATMLLGIGGLGAAMRSRRRQLASAFN